MDPLHEHSDLLSSQPTQLLQHALAPNSAPESQEPSKGSALVWREHDDATKDFSLDSMIIPARSSTPHYPLEDSLAETSNRSGQPLLTVEEGSQKENVMPVSSRENRQLESSAGIAAELPALRSAGNSVHVPAQGSSPEAFNQYQHGDTAISASTGKVIGAGAITFQTSTTVSRPVPRATKSMTVGSRYYPRSPSPLSQDSFGGSVSQDPAEQYLASTKQFDVPLSDLGETPTQEAINPEPDPALTLPDASEHKEFLETAMREYEAQRANRASTSTSSRRGNILVAPTPSNSDESLTTSRHRDDGFSFHKLATDNFSQESRYDFDGASSFDKMLDRDLTDGPEPTPEPTQPNEFNPTQVDDTLPVDVLVSPVMPPQSGGRQSSPSFQWIAPSPSAAVTSSNPKSLLSMVHPRNQYRIARMRNLGVDTVTQSSRMQETQPSDMDMDDILRPRSPLLPLPPCRVESHRVHRSQPCIGLDPEDALDVVPDSEPLRAGPSAPTFGHHQGGTQSPLKHSVQPPSPVSEREPEDFSNSFEESEADIPLVIASKGTRKSPVNAGKTSSLSRKQKSKSAGPAAPKAPSPANDGNTEKLTAVTTKGKNSNAKSESIIPTSLPGQDLASSSSQSNSIDKRRDRKPSPSPRDSPPARSRATPILSESTVKVIAGKKRSHSSDTESSEEWSRHPPEDYRNRLPLTQEEEEDSEDDHTDDIQVDLPPSPPVKLEASRKKRRTDEDAKPSRGTSKASTTMTRSKRSETPVTVTTRSAKRLRSAGLSTIRASTSGSATRVFALWRKDGHYYSGVVYSLESKNKYTIKFDDGTEDVVEVKNMRRYELMVGDRVIHSNVKGTVHNVSQMDPDASFVMKIDDGNKTFTMPLKASDIRIANRTVQSQWKERTLTAETIITVIKPKPLLDVTPSRQSFLSMTSTAAQREFAKTGFVVTLGPKNDDPVRAKESAMSSIREHGGLVIEDWSNVFAMKGKHSHANRRWVATREDFYWKSDTNLDRVFLLSDDSHQKPKFLLALALGIPCLSFEWLTNEGTPSSDWQPFLLPAGYSDTLGARMSQLVDLDWGNCIEHLTDIMSNRTAPKLLWEKTVLCVGVDLVPLPATRARKKTNTSDAERAQEAARYVPWIILCMGAAKVEAVTDVKQISVDYMRTFDYIVVREIEDLGSAVDDLHGGVFVGNVRWVKECLTCSRITEPVWED